MPSGWALFYPEPTPPHPPHPPTTPGRWDPTACLPAPTLPCRRRWATWGGHSDSGRLPTHGPCGGHAQDCLPRTHTHHPLGGTTHTTHPTGGVPHPCPHPTPTCPRLPFTQAQTWGCLPALPATPAYNRHPWEADRPHGQAGGPTVRWLAAGYAGRVVPPPTQVGGAGGRTWWTIL